MDKRRYVTVEQYREIRKKVNIANERIRKIQTKYGDKAWAISDLTAKLYRPPLINAINEYSGEIKLNKRMTDATLNAVRSATEEFLKAKTSTLTGIRQAKENMISALKSSLSTDKVELTDKEAQALYRLVEDRNLRTTTEYIGASTLWGLIIDAKSKRATEDQWYQMLLDYNAFGKDLDMKNDLQRIYDEYINKK